MGSFHMCDWYQSLLAPGGEPFNNPETFWTVMTSEHHCLVASFLLGMITEYTWNKPVQTNAVQVMEFFYYIVWHIFKTPTPCIMSSVPNPEDKVNQDQEWPCNGPFPELHPDMELSPVAKKWVKFTPVHPNREPIEIIHFYPEGMCSQS